MTRKMEYYIKQKLFGLMMIIVGALLMLTIDGGIVAAIFMIPIGVIMIFTKEMFLIDDYVDEVERRKMRRRYR